MDRLRVLFRDSRQIFKAMSDISENHRLSWQSLQQTIKETAAEKGFSQELGQHAQQWADYLNKHSRELKTLFQLPYEWRSPQDIQSLEFVRSGNILLTPAQQSMWQHCKLSFENRQPDWEINLVSGYRSPAYETFLFTRMPGSLDEILRHTAPPHFSGHQSVTPDITVKITGKNGRTGEVLPWKEIYPVCSPFGFTRGLGGDKQERELGFIGVDRLYQTTFSNKLIPEQTKKDFFSAMQRTDFYPSPDGMRVLFAISAQESSLSWNPRLNRRKKKDLREKFDRILGNIESAFGGAVSELLFSDELNQEKNRLIEEMKRITNPSNRRIREYDLYLWTQKVGGFLNQLLKENRKITRFGKWLFQLERFAEQIQYEPQTFGLWQINVNHLIERIERHPQLRRRFPEIFIKRGDQWNVARSRMIDVLSGMPDSVLDRQRTLELIIHTYLQPRYQSHLLGHKDDLMFFIAENVAGEMSTFRAGIQQQLNDRVGSRLVLDGDLSFYHPYSTRIDWSRTSNTQKIMRKFIQMRYAYFSRPVDSESLVSSLCEAENWEKLQKSELYRRIMRKEQGLRVFPNIRSDLYQQTPLTYARITMKKSRLF
ncbi:MAG: hypothetical protein ABIK68_19040 [bacterium]